MSGRRCGRKRKAQQRPPQAPVFGSDVAFRMVDFAARNAERAGVAARRAVSRRRRLAAHAARRDARRDAGQPALWRAHRDRRRRRPQPGRARARRRREDGGDFFTQLAAHWKKNYAGWTAWVLTPDLKLPSRMRLKESRRVPMWNGPIECRLFRFDMVKGSARKAMRPLVLDTNVVLDLFVFGDPATRPLQSALERGDCDWLATPAMRDELERVLDYPQHRAADRAYAAGGRRRAGRLRPPRAHGEAPPRRPSPARTPTTRSSSTWRWRIGATLLSKDAAVLTIEKRLAALDVSVLCALPASGAPTSIQLIAVFPSHPGNLRRLAAASAHLVAYQTGVPAQQHARRAQGLARPAPEIEAILVAHDLAGRVELDLASMLLSRCGRLR